MLAAGPEPLGTVSLITIPRPLHGGRGAGLRGSGSRPGTGGKEGAPGGRRGRV